MAEIKGKLEIVDIGKIKPNPWNPNRQSAGMYANQLASIKLHGFIQPVIVREVKGGYELVDGEHRLRAATELGMAKLPIWNLGPKTEAEAKMLTEVFIHLHGSPDLVLEAELIKALVEEHKVDIDTLAHAIPLTTEQITELYQSLSFDWDAMQAPPPIPPPPPSNPEGAVTKAQAAGGNVVTPPLITPPASGPDKFTIVVECTDEEQQVELLEKLQEEGYTATGGAVLVDE